MAASTKQKRQVSERALVARINRKLAKSNQQLRRIRVTWDGSKMYVDSNLGRYYLVNEEKNYVVRTHVDVEALGQEVGVLKGWEQLASE